MNIEGTFVATAEYQLALGSLLKQVCGPVSPVCSTEVQWLPGNDIASVRAQMGPGFSLALDGSQGLRFHLTVAVDLAGRERGCVRPGPRGRMELEVTPPALGSQTGCTRGFEDRGSEGR